LFQHEEKIMQITLADFRKIIKPSGFHKAGLHAVPAVHTTTVRFYCDKLTARSACSEQCHSCLQHVRSRLNTADWAAAENPWALYSWILKDASAAAVEDAQRKAKTPLKPNPLDDDTDGLDMLMETL
jgi:hypothetical protein